MHIHNNSVLYYTAVGLFIYSKARTFKAKAKTSKAKAREPPAQGLASLSTTDIKYRDLTTGQRQLSNEW